MNEIQVGILSPVKFKKSLGAIPLIKVWRT
jgi:hypothetical protein